MKNSGIILILGLLLLVPMAVSQEKSASDTAPSVHQIADQGPYASPRATFKTALENKKAALDGEVQALNTALRCLDLTGVSPISKESVGKEAYYHLIQTLDRLEEIDLDAIPNQLTDQNWIYRKTSFEIDQKQVNAVIAVHLLPDGTWRFTPQTIETIGDYFQYVKNRKVVQGVDAVKTTRDIIFSRFPVLEKKLIYFSVWQWLGFIFLIFLATVLERFLSYFLKRLIERKVKNEGFKKHLKNSGSFLIPLRLLIYSGVLKFGLDWLFLPISIINILNQSSIFLFTVGLVWMANICINVVSSYFATLAVKTENKFDDLLVPLLRKTAKLVVFSAAFLLLAQNIWNDVTGILAGFGIGGLAVALAAKDTLANLFGSLTVLLDRPFQIGDWVHIGNIDGSVEEVGFRSTRVRTFYNSLITVPNNMLTSMAIDNYGARRFRRFKTTIGVEYGTDPEKLEAFCEGIRQLIIRQPAARKDYFHVYFNNLGPSSLDIMLYMFFEVPDWSAELAERHKILINILRLGNELGVQFAFPTQTVRFLREHVPEEKALAHDAYQEGKNHAEQLSSNPIYMKKPRSGIKEGDFPEDTKGW
jgi:MscS family membrane protein